MPEAIGHLSWRQSKTLVPPEREPERRAPSPTPSRLVPQLTYLIVALYALTFAVLSTLQHDSFDTNAFDLGNMDQAVWNTAQGRWFRFTNWEGGTSRLAAHVEPILLPISLLYRLYSSPKALLILQSVVISLGALPAFWLARDRLKNDFAAVTFASAYLLHPALEAANLHDFHPVSLASAFLLFAFYYLEKGWYPLFLLFSLLAMSTKEQVPLSVALMGLYLVLMRGRRFLGWSTVVTALAWLVIAFGVIIPTYNPTGASPYLSRYDQLGGSPREILVTFLLNPQKVLPTLLEPAKLQYAQSLLLPVAFLPFLSPFTFAFALPDLALSLLSNFPDMYSGKAHYGAVIVPFLVISAIYATGFMAGLGQRLWRPLGQPLVYLLSSVVLISSLVSYYHSVFLPLSDHLPVVSQHDKLASEFVARIPKDAPLSTSSTLNPHLSQRERLYLFPDVRDAEYIFLDVTATPYPIDVPSLRWRVEGLLEKGWGILAAKDGYLLLRRGEKNRSLPEGFYSFARAGKPKMQNPLDVTFGPLRLLGYSLEPGRVVHGQAPYASITLFWEATRPVGGDYLVMLSLAAEQGKTISREYYNPTSTWYPTSQWVPGEIVRTDVARLALGSFPRGEILLGLREGSSLEQSRSWLLPSAGTSLQALLRDDGSQVSLGELRRG